MRIKYEKEKEKKQLSINCRKRTNCSFTVILQIIRYKIELAKEKKDYSPIHMEPLKLLESMPMLKLFIIIISIISSKESTYQ